MANPAAVQALANPSTRVSLPVLDHHDHMAPVATKAESSGAPGALCWSALLALRGHSADTLTCLLFILRGTDMAAES